MKTLLTTLLLLFYLSNFSQIVVTPDGLKDSENLENNYIVLEIEGKLQNELYNNAIKYINENYKNPNEVITAKTENEYLKFDTYIPQMFYYNNSGAKIPIDTKYTIELKFKDEKVKYEIVSIEMYNFNANLNKNIFVLFSGGLFDGYIIYKKNGNLFKEDTKLTIEKYFNSEITKLKEYLTGKIEENW